MDISKKYWLFGRPDHRSKGGMNDFKGSFYSVTDARDEVEELDWYHILNISNGNIVERYNSLIESEV